MPVKLSGGLVAEARKWANLAHRSLTGEIEHWAAIGRAVEAQLPGDAVAQMVARLGGTLKIGSVADAAKRKQVMAAEAAGLCPEDVSVADAAKRKQVMAVLAEFMGKTTDDGLWLREISARGVPLYGTDGEGIVRMNPDGSREKVPSAGPAARHLG